MKKVLIHTNNHHLSLGMRIALKNELRKRKIRVSTDSPDLIIVVGGDGTMLSAIKKYRHLKVPYVGINTGHLGFLSSFMPDDLDQMLDDLHEENYFKHAAPILEATIHYADGTSVKKFAFNEFVIKSACIKLFKCEILINNMYFNTFAGDGLVISTPFGSTGYAIWCGGNAIAGELDVLQLTPICPNDNAINYTLKTSMIMNMNSVIEIRLNKPAKDEILVSGDSVTTKDAGIESIRIKAMEENVELIFPYDYDYFQLYKSKILDKKPTHG